jgi:TM2 domain-containing membrane protein YozV
LQGSGAVVCEVCGQESVGAASYSFCAHCGADLPATGAGRTSSAEAGTYGQAWRSEAGANQGMAPAPLGSRRRQGAWSSSSVHGAAAARSAHSPRLCAVLSFFFPGLGQILNQQAAKGLALMLAAFIAVGYLGWSTMGLPMLIGRILVALDAARIAAKRREGLRVGEWEWAIQSDKRGHGR